MRKVVIAGVVGVVLLLAAWFAYSNANKNRTGTITNTVTPPPNGNATITPHTQATLTGTYVCLPHKDTSGPQTMECAFGIQANDGNYYALSMGDNITHQFQSGQPVTVTGLLIPIEMVSDFTWQKYNVQGVMQVESLSEN